MQDSLNFVDSLGENTFTLINTVIAIIGSLIVGVVMFFLGRIYGKKDALKATEIEVSLGKEKEFSESKKEFVATFDDALTRLKSKGQGASGIMCETMPSHEVAYIKFRRIFLEIKDGDAVDGFDEAWNHYYNEHPNHFATYHSNRFEGAGQREKEQAAKDSVINSV